MKKMRRFNRWSAVFMGAFVTALLILWWPRVKAASPNSPVVLGQVFDEDRSNPEVRANPIELETLVPETVLPIPANSRDIYTPVRFGVRVTNNTQVPVYFARDSFTPEFRDASGENLFYEESQFTPILNKKEDFPLVQPGESFTLFWDGRLYWSDNKLILILWDKRYARSLSFGAFKHEFVKVRWNYSNIYALRAYIDENRIGLGEIAGVWAEKMCGPWIELNLSFALIRSGGKAT